jgi:triphosphoribosyl-dephospho-CoA synthase
MSSISISQRVRLACLLESTARKPGNVHRYADFDDASYLDFVSSAIAFGDAIASLDLPRCNVGTIVLESVRSIMHAAEHNTLLGTVLLLAPLAKASGSGGLREQLAYVLTALTVDDARLAYEAIRSARPAGLGRVEAHDVATEPTISLGQAMACAAERDLVARQYTNNYSEVFDVALPTLLVGLNRGATLEAALIRAHLTLMARYPDTLIARKCGLDVAHESARRASKVLNAGWPDTPEGRHLLNGLDAWLRADGRRRNPGTSADLVAATAYAALYDGVIATPIDWRREFPPEFP